jgi:hypothetical protein
MPETGEITALEFTGLFRGGDSARGLPTQLPLHYNTSIGVRKIYKIGLADFKFDIKLVRQLTVYYIEK